MGEAGTGVCGAKLCMLEEAIEFCPSVCEAAEAGLSIEAGCALCVELCLEVEDGLECGF